ncbi:MAG: hypothetical protein RJA22_935 [Verrucomicrobiota bacterium]|jgi:ABC-type transporter Mla maintaining outer membrane lipid asymmetry ATPase subunit MlaF
MSAPLPDSSAAPAAPAACPALELCGVSVPASDDPGRTVLEEVNWSVAVGDYWAVGGLARSGKSRLLAVAAGLQRPGRGACRVFGCDTRPDPATREAAWRRRVGYVFDGGQLIHQLTLAENVALPLRYHWVEGEPDPAARIEALVGLTGLEAWGGRYPAQVSRNWQQRFGLARALALGPELLLLDDPLSGLDPQEAAWWLETLAGLAAGHPLLGGRPLTLVVTGNDLRPWRRSARQFAILQDRAFLTLGGLPDADTDVPPVLAQLLRPWHP